MKSSSTLAEQLVATLPSGRPDLFNPWTDVCPDDEEWNGPKVKLERLAAHLAGHPRLILIGEAPGYQGCRHSGIAFTSERLLLEGKIPRMKPLSGRLTRRERPFSEPSATIVWGALDRLGLSDGAILWNAVQLHPHPPGEIRANRTPTLDELLLGKPALDLLVRAFPSVPLIAVGRKAGDLLSLMGRPPSAALRHPANGGASLFFQGLEKFAATLTGTGSTHGS